LSRRDISRLRPFGPKSLEISSGKPSSDPKELKPGLIRKITTFFVSYNEMQGKEFKVLRHSGPDRAAKRIKSGTV